MIFSCARCNAALTREVEALTDETLLGVGRQTRVPPGFHHAGSVHPHDLLTQQVKVSGFGCCGYAPHIDEKNLACLCGEPAGYFSDECSMPFELTFRQRVPGAIQNDTPWEESQWQLETHRRTIARDLRFHIGAEVTAMVDGQPLALPFPALVLRRARALKQLPFGTPALCMVHSQGQQSWAFVQENDSGLIWLDDKDVTCIEAPLEWMQLEWLRACEA